TTNSRSSSPILPHIVCCNAHVRRRRGGGLSYCTASLSCRHLTCGQYCGGRDNPITELCETSARGATAHHNYSDIDINTSLLRSTALMGDKITANMCFFHTKQFVRAVKLNIVIR
ncbi:hypothetical protein J6590_066827, partial [Homalodisca vitripennis]